MTKLIPCSSHSPSSRPCSGSDPAHGSALGVDRSGCYGCLEPSSSVTPRAPRTFLKLDPSRPLHEPGGTRVTGASDLSLMKESGPSHPLHEPPGKCSGRLESSSSLAPRAPRIFLELDPSYPLHTPQESRCYGYLGPSSSLTPRAPYTSPGERVLRVPRTYL